MGILLLGLSQIGRAQVNLGIAYPGADFPFIDVVHMLDRPWEGSGASEDPNILIGATGYPSRAVTGAQWTSYTSVFLTTSDPWVLTWTGTATPVLNMQVAGLSVSTASSANRVEYTIGAGTSGLSIGAPAGVQIVITSMTSISNLRLFRKSQETILNGGSVFNPDFLATYSPYGRVRFMDWQSVNNNSTVRWADRTTQSNISWVGSNLNASVYTGIAVLSGNAYTAPNAVTGNPSSWVNGQMIQANLPGSGAIPFKSVTGFTNTSPANVTAVAHGFATNDVVFFTQGSFGFASLGSKNIDNQLWGNFYTITKIDADNFTLNGVNSTTWGAYVSGGVVAKQITLAAGLLPAKRIVTADLGGLHSTDISNVTNGYSYAVANMVYNSDVDALVLSTTAAGYQAAGMPFETMVSLANALNVSPWFCVPANAEDDYVTQAATYVFNNLNSNLVVSWELSNEVWNSLFNQTIAAFKTGNVKWGLLGLQSVDEWYGWRFYSVAGLINTVYAGRLNRIELQFGVWTANYAASAGTLANRFEASATGVAAFPISLATGIAIAPYFESDRATTSSAQYVWGQTQGGSLATAAMAWLDAYLRDDGINTFYTVKNLHDSVFPAWKTIANAPASGVSAKKLTQYEGGWGYIPQLNPLTANNWLGNPLTSTDRDNFYFAYYRTDLFAQLWLDNANNFVSAGGEYPSQYTLIGKNWGASAMWGMVQPGLYATPVPALAALRSFNGR